MPITISGSTGIAGVDGSAGTPAVQGTDTNTGIFFPAADTIAFGEGGSERMRIDSSGNVGIGTSSPATKLDVVSTGTTSTIIQTRNGTTSVYLDANNGYSYLNTFTNHPMLFGTNNAERMRIDPSGNFLVGTTSSSLISGNTSTVGTSIAFGSVASARSDFEPLYLNKLGSDGNAASFWKAGTFVGSISVTSSATAYNTSSDYRLKHNVHPMVSGLSTIAALKPSTYKWNADNSYGEGFIAHELQAVIPLAVSGEKDAVNEDGSINPQGVDYSKIVVHLVAAIQELKADNDAMKERIATLEAK
jgi:hypothetical protein